MMPTKTDKQEAYDSMAECMGHAPDVLKGLRIFALPDEAGLSAEEMTERSVAMDCAAAFACSVLEFLRICHERRPQREHVQ